MPLQRYLPCAAERVLQARSLCCTIKRGFVNNYFLHLKSTVHSLPLYFIAWVADNFPVRLLSENSLSCYAFPSVGTWGLIKTSLGFAALMQQGLGKLFFFLLRNNQVSADSLHAPAALVRNSYLFARSFLDSQLWFSWSYCEMGETCGSGKAYGLMVCYGKPRALYLKPWLSSSGAGWCLSVLPCCPSEADHVPPRAVGSVQVTQGCGSPKSGAGGRMPWAVLAGWWVLLGQWGVLGPSLVFLTPMCPDQDRWMHLPCLLLDAAARLSPEPLSMILRLKDA